jgi:2-polyprenyl-3-methyl-5-hydroxy-6-metoxy-1,4-benzoquinol methylase
MMADSNKYSAQENFRIASAYSAARGGRALEFAVRLTLRSLRQVVPDLSSATVLDLGCGYSNVLFAEWLASASKVVGIDRRQEDVRRNTNLQMRVVGDVEKAPLADSSVDMIVSSFVIEHVEDPLALLTECQRMLKPNGAAVFCTPCFFGYKTLIARFSGRKIANLVWKLLKGKPHPPWPDYYRANTPAKIRQLCTQSGLVLERLVFIPEPPHFFHNFPLLFALARAWDRFLEVTHLPILHNSMAYVLRRPVHDHSVI